MIVSDSLKTLFTTKPTSRSKTEETSWTELDDKSGKGPSIAYLTPAHGSKLADALWSLGANGPLTHQNTDGIWYGDKPEPNASEEFLKISSMTSAERIRYFYLKDQELDEDKLAAMSPQDQEAIEQEIRQLILERLGLADEDGKSGEDAVPPVPDANSAAAAIVSV
jgi:hypothetical protein